MSDRTDSSPVTVVLGAGSGIGLATARLLRSQGHRVVAADLCVAGSEAGRTDDPGYLRHACDVRSEASINAVLQAARERFGHVDGLVNSAGITGPRGSLIETSADEWDEAHAILVRGVFLSIKLAAQCFIDQGRDGAIVVIGSIAGQHGGIAGAAYCSAKAAVHSLVQASAVQLAQHRIRVNGVAPGYILTPLLAQGRDVEELALLMSRSQPWPAHGTPEHVAQAVSFLLDPERSGFVTGTELTVDGGVLADGPGRKPHQMAFRPVVPPAAAARS